MENIDELKHTISDRERTIAEQQRIIDELNIAIDKQNAEIKRKNAENRRLQAQYAMKCDDFNTIESAFFWKMTKPLRVILDKLKWALRNNKVAHKIWDTLKSIKGGDKKEKVELQPSEFFGKGDSIVILCTRHTLFVANLIKNSLSKASVDANIIMKEPDKYETDSAYIVICPQMFKKLPEKFIAFQMEQTVSSRWLTNSYYDKLAKAYAIFDYSLNNIKYFKDNTELGKLFYYMPIDFHPNYEAECCGYEYDVLFYGDINNLRRKEMIEELRKHFSVKVVSEVFGEELYDELSRAKIVVNIHYYENAMLETTRIYEVLSLGRSIVISERSSDPEEEKRLDGIVDFVDIGDTDAMTDRIAYWLSDEEKRISAVTENKKKLKARPNSFDYFFQRFLLANDLVSFDKFYELCGDYVHFNGNRVCLSLPEAVDRREAFDNDNRFGFEVMPGLRHFRGWTGCGLSYKFIMKKAQEQGMEDILVCEDDVLFPDDFKPRFEKCLAYLSVNSGWDIFQGLMADVGREKVSCVERYEGQTFVWLNHMMSMVFNYYRSSVFESIVAWDEKNDDVFKNTIDRSLEHKKLNIVATAPFLVGHKEELDSVIWDFNNMRYNQMIEKSSERIEKLVSEFENRK